MALKRNLPLVMMAAICGLLITINFYTIRITSGVRAYINGESRYSKGQMEAARHLLAYIPTGAKHHRDRFFEEIAVPVGDRIAREALMNGGNVALAKEGFLAGNNHPDDLDDMIWLFRNFKDVSFMREAIGIWQSGDGHIAELNQLALQIFADGDIARTANSRQYIQNIDELSKKLSAEEKAFSQVLGAAARKINNYLFVTNIVLIILIVGTASRTWSTVLSNVRKSNLQLRKTLGFGKMGSAVLDHKGTGLVAMSPEFKQILDLPADSRETFTLEKFVQEFVIPEDQHLVMRATNSGLESKVPNAEVSVQYRIKTRAGNLKLIDAQGFFLENEVFGIFKDITSIRRIEEEIVESEKRLKSILGALPIAVYLTDEEGRITSFNQAAAALWGRKPVLLEEKWCGSHRLFTTAEKEMPHDHCPMAVAVKEKRPVYGVQAKLQRPDGTMVDFLAHATPFWTQTNSFAGAMNVMIDITGQKRQENEILTNKKFLSTLIGNLPGFVYRCKNDAAYTITYISQQATSITGYTPAEFLSGEITPGKTIHPDDLDLVASMVSEALDNDTTFDIEYRIIKKNGEISWVWEKGRGIRDNDGILEYLEGFVEDITAHKESEIAVRESEERYRNLIRELHVGVAIYNADHEITMVNEAITKAFGVSEAELVSAKRLGALVTLLGENEDPVAVEELPIRRVLETKKALYGTTLGARLRDGSTVWVIADAIPVFNEQKNLVHVICTFTDITEKVHASQKEKETATRLLLAASAASLGVWEINLADQTSIADDQLHSILCTPEQFKAHPFKWWQQIVHADDRERVFAQMNRAMTTGHYSSEYRIKPGDRPVRYISSRGIVEKDMAGTPVRMVGVASDVTENKLAQKAVEESERRFRHVADSAPVMIWMTDTGRNGTYFNKGWLDFTGQSIEQQVGCGWTSRISPDDRESFFNLFDSSFSSKESFQVTLRMLNHEEEVRWLQVHGVPRYDVEGDFLGFIGSCIDVSESVEMSTTLARNHVLLEGLVQEKDLLIKEIHHRVKNNLQVMSSVLFLKAQTLQDPAMRELLTESRHRLRSMAMIHERLMQSGGQITQLSIRDYVTGLILEQKQALLIDPEQIAVDMYVEDRMMNLDQVVNIGFIINETFTNSIKHAFPSRQGKIRIELRNTDEKVQLRIADNGIGLPEHVSLENTNLFGIQLIKVFTSHLGGHVQVDGKNGTAWTVVF